MSNQILSAFDKCQLELSFPNQILRVFDECLCQLELFFPNQILSPFSLSSGFFSSGCFSLGLGGSAAFGSCDITGLVCPTLRFCDITGFDCPGFEFNGSVVLELLS